MHRDGDVRLSWNPAQHRKRFLSILFDCLCFLVIVAWSRQRPVMRDALLVVNSVVGVSARSKGVDFALVLARIRFFEVTWQFIRTWLGKLIIVFYITEKR